MNTINYTQQLPIYSLEPDEITGNKNFRVYNFEGDFPSLSDLLIPHRKNHYLFVFIKKAETRQWIDMMPYKLKENTVYFTGPGPVIVKEEFNQLWSKGIAFTSEFLSFQEGASLSKLPLILNPFKGYELLLNDADVRFVEDMIDKISVEYHRPGEWQQRMLTAYLTVLLTYLSRIYTAQYNDQEPSAEKLLLSKFQEKINEYFLECHEVGDYASMLNISAGHLSEVVKTQSGKPAIKHIHDRLVLEARRMLVHTDNSLKEITYYLGFSDASYFNRFFKRETGITPAEYRTTIREMYH
ncbi:helix-turn-helix domain-containing protein [Dyadobacter sp. CY356]|uniref:AraC family transcriptional regulator n=1 Tax=Dyadobacter sp. CY356 TaxID=2906442 RepID=UPI001F445598|nr:helix-turn-helix domain-containing protein [Dyadobacter sp. CY356]MCF0055941.1 helix-turn-helix domain-containing protein [Dyadobacter sp. CY356]